MQWLGRGLLSCLRIWVLRLMTHRTRPAPSIREARLALALCWAQLGWDGPTIKAHMDAVFPPPKRRAPEPPAATDAEIADQFDGPLHP